LKGRLYTLCHTRHEPKGGGGRGSRSQSGARRAWTDSAQVPPEVPPVAQG
jgi:hypothetical protein